ncbi:MAG: nucleoside-diphosphate kinase [Nitrososphaerales archaeon]
MEEKTLIILKPDAVERGLIGRILSRFEDRGFKLIDLRLVTLSEGKAREFYSIHADKPFFGDLIEFITSGSVVAGILQGVDAIRVVRLMVGSTKSPEAESGTIRGDYGLGTTDNVIHASDSSSSFKRESELIFS